MIVKSLAAAAALAVVFGALAVSAEAKSVKCNSGVQLFCYDNPWRCARYVRGVCRGYLYTDVWGDKRCVRDRNGKRGVRYHRSWGSSLLFDP